MKRQWMVDHRKQVGMTQEEVAERIGISRSYYTQIENGTHNPSPVVGLRLSNFFDVELGKFYFVECCNTQLIKRVK